MRLFQAKYPLKSIILSGLILLFLGFIYLATYSFIRIDSIFPAVLLGMLIFGLFLGFELYLRVQENIDLKYKHLQQQIGSLKLEYKTVLDRIPSNNSDKKFKDLRDLINEKTEKLDKSIVKILQQVKPGPPVQSPNKPVKINSKTTNEPKTITLKTENPLAALLSSWNQDSPPKISACICTYNRASYLEKAIESLFNQSLPKHQYEIIVIDCASTDSTRAICESYESVPNFRYIYQPQIGTSNARNLGYQKANSSFIAYLDDDAIAAENWLNGFLNVFESSPEAGVAGGIIDLNFESTRPDWFEDFLLPYHSYLNYGDDELEIFPIAKDHEPIRHVYGCNIAFSKSALQAINGFNSLLGPYGNEPIYCEEILAQKLIAREGFKVFYTPEAKISHAIQKDRLQINWNLKRFFKEGFSNVIMRRLMDESPSIDDIDFIPPDDANEFQQQIFKAYKIGFEKALACESEDLTSLINASLFTRSIRKKITKLPSST